MEFSKSDILNFNSFIESKKSEYAQSIVKDLNGIIELDDSIEFVNILMLYSHSEYNKNKALKEFDFFTNYIVIKYTPAVSTNIILFFISVLVANRIITECEGKAMNKNFIESITAFISEK